MKDKKAETKDTKVEIIERLKKLKLTRDKKSRN